MQRLHKLHPLKPPARATPTAPWRPTQKGFSGRRRKALRCTDPTQQQTAFCETGIRVPLRGSGDQRRRGYPQVRLRPRGRTDIREMSWRRRSSSVLKGNAQALEEIDQLGEWEDGGIACKDDRDSCDAVKRGWTVLVAHAADTLISPVGYA
jgi:hypothetical protein